MFIGYLSEEKEVTLPIVLFRNLKVVRFSQQLTAFLARLSEHILLDNFLSY